MTDPLKFAEYLDAYRVIPRLLVALYGALCADAWFWFRALEAPTTQQTSTFAAILTGAAAWFAFYTNTGRRWQ